MRYIVADEQSVSLEDIGKAFAEAGVEYDVDGEETEVTITYPGQGQRPCHTERTRRRSIRGGTRRAYRVCGGG